LIKILIQKLPALVFLKIKRTDDYIAFILGRPVSILIFAFDVKVEESIPVSEVFLSV